MIKIAAFISEPLALILLITLGIMTTIATFSIIKFFQWVIKKILINKKGYISGRFVLPNKREFKKLVKVQHEKIEVKLPGDAKGAKSTFNFDPNKLTYNGGDPTATFVATSITPLDLMNPKVKQSVSSEDISNLVIRSFNLGLIAAIKKQDILKLLVIICVIVAAGAVIFSYLNNAVVTNIETKMGELEPKINDIPKTVSEAVTSSIQQYQGQKTGVLIPVE